MSFFPFAGKQVGLCVVLTFIEESLVGYMLFLLWNTFKQCLFFADLLNGSRVRFLRGFLLDLGIEGHEKNITEYSYFLFVFHFICNFSMDMY